MAGSDGGREVFAVCIDRYENDRNRTLGLESARKVTEEFISIAESLGFTAGSEIISGTQKQVEHGLEALVESQAERKLVYWTGHGTRNGWLPCSDWKKGRGSKALGTEYLGQLLHSTVGDILFVVDACHSNLTAKKIFEYVSGQEEHNRKQGPGRGVERAVCVAGTCQGDDQSQVGTWVTALRKVCEDPATSIKENEELWTRYASEVSAGGVLDGVISRLGKEESHQQPTFFSMGNLSSFFLNRHYQPKAGPVLVSSYKKTVFLKDSQVDELRESRFPGLRLESEERFVGRRPSLDKVTSWLVTPESRGLMVVTGSAGCGKSELLARVARMTLAGDVADSGLTPERRGRLIGSLTAGIRCRGKNAFECAVDLASELALTSPPSGWKHVRDVVRSIRGWCDQNKGAAFLIDGLDEAEHVPDSSVENDLIRPLSDHPGVKVLLGARSGSLVEELVRLSSGISVDLDEDEDKNEDLSAYVRERLTDLESPYDDDMVDRVVQEVVERSEGIFLTARLYCSALTRLSKAVAPSSPEFQNILEEGPRQVLTHELQKIDDLAYKDRGWSSGLLLPLALSRGSGLPTSDLVWLRSANEIAYRHIGDHPYEEEDIHSILKFAGSHIETSGEEGQQVYTLQHETMASHLIKSSGRSKKELHSMVMEALFDAHWRNYRGRMSTNPYAVRYLPVHAYESGRLADLFLHPEMAVLIDPERAAIQLGRKGITSSPPMELYRSVSEKLVSKSPPERAALLQATALQQDLRQVQWARRAGGVYWDDLWTTAGVEPLSTQMPTRGAFIRTLADPGKKGFLLGAGDQLWLWSGGEMQFLCDFPKPQGLPGTQIHALQVGPAESPVAAVAADRDRVLVVMRDFTSVFPLGWGADISDVALTRTVRGNELIAAASREEVVLWNLEKNRPRMLRRFIWPIEKGRPYAVAFFAFGDQTLLSVAGDGGCHLWDADMGESIAWFGSDSGMCTALSVDQDGEGVWVTLLGTRAPELRTWYMALDRSRPSLVHEATLEHGSESTISLRVRKGRTLLAATDGDAVRIWDVQSGVQLASLGGHTSRPTGLTWLADGGLAVAEGGRVRVWSDPLSSSEAATQRRLLGGNRRHPGACTWHEDDGVIVLAGEGAHSWDLDGRHIADVPALGRVLSVDVVRTGTGRFLIGTGGSTSEGRPLVRVHDLASGEQRDFQPESAHRDNSIGSVSLAALPRMTTMFAGLGRGILSWDVDRGESLNTRWVPDGKVEKMIVIPGRDGIVSLVAAAGDSLWVWPDISDDNPLHFGLGEGPVRALSGTHGLFGESWFAAATEEGVYLHQIILEEEDLRPTVQARGISSLALVSCQGGRLVLVAANGTTRLSLWSYDGTEILESEIPDRGYSVHTVLAVPRDFGVLVAAAGMERMDVLRVPTDPRNALWRKRRE